MRTNVENYNGQNAIFMTVDFKKTLLDQIGSYIGRYGFVPKLRGQSFFWPAQFGKGIFHLAFVPHKNIYCDVTADVAIRIDAVENIINSERHDLSVADKLSTATLGCELGNLSEGKQKRWTMTSASDIRSISRALEEELTAAVLPFFERFSKLEYVFEVLLDFSPKQWIFAPIYSARCERVVTLAFILGRYQQMEILLKDYEKLLSERGDFGLERFTKLSVFLRRQIPK